jgi:polar amino acid transport system substrate-binding protein
VNVLRTLIVLLLAATVAAQIQIPQKYRDKGVLNWGASADGGAPFVYLDPVDPAKGEIGFEVEIIAELSRLFGVKIVRKETLFDLLQPSLERGDIDIAMNGFEPSAARRERMRFSRPYYIFQQQLSVAKTTKGIQTLQDLKGKRVGVLGQSQSHQLVLATPGVEAVVYESNSAAYQDVLLGRTQASLADLPIARGLRYQFPDLIDVGEPFGEFYYAAAVRRDEPELQRALDQAFELLIRDGTLERIYRKWNLWVPAEERLGTEAMANMEASGDAVDMIEFRWSSALALLGQGALRTLSISVIAFALAVTLGLGIALARLYGSKPVRFAATTYVELLRGTPILVQMLLIYYGLGQIEGLRMPAEVAGVLGLALNYAAYEAEIYRGAISAIPRGQREAAMSLGLTTSQSLRHVIVPQALRLSLAPSTNDFIALFKDSSIVMVITVVELTKQYQMLANATGRFILLGLLTSALYLTMSLPLAFAARRFERSLDKDAA